MRRFTAAAGAALVVLAFVGFMVAISIEALAGSWLPIATLCLVPIGFVVMWEAQIVWPEDGGSYPWRRRVAGLTVGVATAAAAVVTRGALTMTLPHHWLASTIATAAGIVVGDAVLRRLRRVFTHRFGSSPPPSDPAEVETP